MKNLIVLSLTLLVSSFLFAQQQIADPKINFGIKAGLAFPTLSLSGVDANGISSSSLTSYYVSSLISVHIIDGVHFQPGLSLVGKGASLITSSSTTKLTPLYLEVPLNFVVSRNVGTGKVFFGAGPYWAFPIAGKLKVSGNPDRNLRSGSDVDDDIKSSDFGFNFQLGYQLKNGLSINGGYGLGLKNIQPNNVNIDRSYKNSVFSVGLGFLF